MENRLIINDKCLGWLMTILIVNNIIAQTFKIEVMYYALFLLLFIIAISKSKITSIHFGMFLLYLACLLSIAINNVPIFFRSWERFCSFIIVTLILSPFIESAFLNRIRVRLFNYSQWLLQIIIIISFIFYLLGINFSGRRDFSGIVGQSMLVAPIAANVVISSIYYLTREVKMNTRAKSYFITLTIMALLSLLLAASRTALAAVSASVAIYALCVYRKNLHYLLKGVFVIASIALLTFAYWNPYLDNVKNKNKGSISAGGMTSSRDEHWQSRVNEFKSSPFFGIGFATVSAEEEGATFDKNSGQVETGSSWLNILSMTGIVGLICFISIWFKDILYITKLYRIDKHYSSYLFSLLVFWAFHMAAEGYIFAAGGFLFFCVWLLLGYIYIIGKHPHYIKVVS